METNAKTITLRRPSQPNLSGATSGALVELAAAQMKIAALEAHAEQLANRLRLSEIGLAYYRAKFRAPIREHTSLRYIQGLALGEAAQGPEAIGHMNDVLIHGQVIGKAPSKRI